MQLICTNLKHWKIIRKKNLQKIYRFHGPPNERNSPALKRFMGQKHQQREGQHVAAPDLLTVDFV